MNKQHSAASWRRMPRRLTTLLSHAFRALRCRFTTPASALIGSLVVLCSSCAPNVPPQHTDASYVQMALGPDTFRVVHQAEDGLSPERNLDLTLLKASQITQEHQFCCFAVIDEEATTTGQVVYYAGLNQFELKPSRGLLIKCFETKPKRVFTFNAESLAKMINEKMNLSR